MLRVICVPYAQLPIAGTGAHIWQEVLHIGTSKQKVFVYGVKYMSDFVLLFETKMSAPSLKLSLAAIINMIPLNTRKQEILTMKIYTSLWFCKRCVQ